MSINQAAAEELLAKIQHWTNSLNQECLEFRKLMNSQAKSPNAPLVLSKNRPNVRLVGQNLWVDHLLIPISTRERTLRLLEAFFQDQGMVLKKTEILDFVYRDSPDTVSERLNSSLECRLTKLMSRTRMFLNSALSHANGYQNIEWFAFDSKTQTYCLHVEQDFTPRGEFELLTRQGVTPRT